MCIVLNGIVKLALHRKVSVSNLVLRLSTGEPHERIFSHEKPGFEATECCLLQSAICSYVCACVSLTDPTDQAGKLDDKY